VHGARYILPALQNADAIGHWLGCSLQKRDFGYLERIAQLRTKYFSDSKRSWADHRRVELNGKFESYAG